MYIEVALVHQNSEVDLPSFQRSIWRSCPLRANSGSPFRSPGGGRHLERARDADEALDPGLFCPLEHQLEVRRVPLLAVVYLSRDALGSWWRGSCGRFMNDAGCFSGEFEQTSTQMGEAKRRGRGTCPLEHGVAQIHAGVNEPHLLAFRSFRHCRHCQQRPRRSQA